MKTKKKTTERVNGFYEVILKLMNHGREIGRTCLQLRATSPFMTAAVSPSAEIKVLELEKQHVE